MHRDPKHHSLVGAGLLCLCLGLGTSAFAQTATTPVPATDAGTVTLDPYQVKGFRSSMGNAIADKRAAGQETDSITAEQVGQFGQQDVGEALQRIAGVTLTRNNGEGQWVSIRGLSPDFTRVTLDGRSAYMTVDRNEPERRVLLSVFAADLYNKIEVVKSPTAADVEGGLGGTVRLETPNPLDTGRLRAGLKAQLSDAEMRNRREGSYSGFFSDVFLKKRLGVLFSFTHDDRDRRLDKVTTGDNPFWAPVVSADPALNGGRYPQRFREEMRTGDNPKNNYNAKIQFQATPELQLFANTLLTREERHENKANIQVQFTSGTFITGVKDAAGTLTSAQFTGGQTQFNDDTRDTKVATTGITGGFLWTPHLWRIEGKANYYDSKEDFDDYTLKGQINKDGIGGYEVGDDPKTPRLYTAALLLPLSSIPISTLLDNKRIISIQEDEYKLDVKRTVERGFLSALQAGGRIAETTFDRKQGGPPSPALKDTNGSALTMASGASPYIVDGSFAHGRGGSDFLTSWPDIDAKALFLRLAPAGPVTFTNADYFHIVEKDSAAYAMANFESQIGGAFIKGNIGVRAVKTDVRGVGRISLTAASLNGTVAIDNAPPLKADYTEPLPSLNVVFQPHANSNFVVRGAIARNMERPTVAQMTPAQSINADTLIVTAGNPNLKPFLAWQYDLGAEYYFGEKHEGMFSVGVFTKDVQNFIAAKSTTAVYAFPDRGIPSATYTVASFSNAGKASIKGLEVNLQSPFTFLPGFLKNFGGALNYTYTDSEFTNQNGFTYTFPGASKHAGNLVLYYEQNGFSARAAFVKRTDWLETPTSSADGTNTVYGSGSGRLDFSVRYRFKNGLRLSVDAMNLTREQTYLYWDIPGRFENYEVDGRIIVAGVGYDF